jgi:hypothetical protein
MADAAKVIFLTALGISLGLLAAAGVGSIFKVEPRSYAASAMVYIFMTIGASGLVWLGSALP